MNEKDNIARKIISDAEKQAAEIVDSAMERARKNEDFESEKAEEYLLKDRENSQKDGENLIERKKTLAKLDGKKVMLVARQQLIEEVSESALNCLKNLDKKQYFDFVISKIRQFCKEGDVVILDKNSPFSANDLMADKVFMEKRLSAKIGDDIGGGVILANDKTDIDLTFKTIVKQAAENFGAEISTKLFD